MASNPLLATKQWLKSTLSADAALTSLVGPRIYDQEAEQGAAYPFVVYRMLSGVDTNTSSGDRVLSTYVFVVKGVNEGNSCADPLETISLRIDALLQRNGGRVSRGQVFECIRQGDFNQLETDYKSGNQFSHLGGTYRILSQ